MLNGASHFNMILVVYNRQYMIFHDFIVVCIVWFIRVFDFQHVSSGLRLKDRLFF